MWGESLTRGAARIRLQEDRPQWRTRERDAVKMAMLSNRRRVDSAQVSLAAAAINRRVAVDELEPATRQWHADLIVVARHRREVEDRNDQLIVRASAHEADHALLGVGDVNPRETGWVEVKLVQRLLLAHDPVQVAGPSAQPVVHRLVQQVPVEALLVVPFAPLSKLADPGQTRSDP